MQASTNKIQQGLELRINQLLASLSLPEKVGQLFMLAFAGQDLAYARELVQQFHIGGFYLTDDNAPDPEQAQALNLELQRLAALRSVDAPLLLGVDHAAGLLLQGRQAAQANLQFRHLFQLWLMRFIN